jgi:hypothetical protein
MLIVNSTTLFWRFGLAGMAAAWSLALPLTSFGQAAGAKIPPAVRSYIQEMDRACKDLGENPDRTLAYVKRADVTGDKITDFVIDDGDYMCGGQPQMLVGQAGGGNVVFMGDAKGGATLVYDEGVGMGIRVARSRAGQVVALVTVAQGCGATAKNAGSCERPLIWNPATKKMRFGPPQPLGY